METKTGLTSVSSDRIQSVDFFRGFTMFLLAGESTWLFEHLLESNNAVAHFFGTQLSHHPWHGLRFWDLIQPFFMFIVGVAIPFAVANRRKKGESDRKITLHAFRRAFILLFLGWALYFMEAGGSLVFHLQNVLAQLSITYIVAFLIREKSARFQILFSILILLCIDLAYRLFPVEGFNKPWVMFQDLGAWFNQLLEGTKDRTDWATLNFISTTAHTIWGVLCGRLLMSDRKPAEKIRLLLIAGFSALATGYLLDFADITPIIKRIATASFVLASGGWAILALCFCYWLIDVKKLFLKGSGFFIIVGTNSIFIYMFFSVGGSKLLHDMANPFSKLLFSWGGGYMVAIMTSLLVWTALWYMCYWLFKNKVFIKI